MNMLIPYQTGKYYIFASFIKRMYIYKQKNLK